MVKKLIEVAIPLDAINRASREEKSVPRHGHPQTLHFWWARRPLAAARAVLFAQMVDDPSEHPDLFPTAKAQDKERQKLFALIDKLARWENIENEPLLNDARDEVALCWRYACAENADHPQAQELFDRYRMPPFSDPFAGGGTLPLEAQRLGLESYASDLNPVAVLINKALIEIPPLFAANRAANPNCQVGANLIDSEWRNLHGMAADVRYYGRRILDELKKRIGSSYPKVNVLPELAKSRLDLRHLAGSDLDVLAWFWARTVNSPNPALNGLEVPLAGTFLFSSKPGREAYAEPILTDRGYEFTVKIGASQSLETAKAGTKTSRGNFKCLLSNSPIPPDYIMSEGRAKRLGLRLLAVMATAGNERVYLPPIVVDETAVLRIQPRWKPDVEFFQNALGFRIGNYGLENWSDLFTNRQLRFLSEALDLIGVIRDEIYNDAINVGYRADGIGLVNLGTGARAYAEAVSVYLACALSRCASYNNSFCTWNMKGGSVAQIFGRQAIPMSWDFIEVNPLVTMSGNWEGAIEWVADVLDKLAPTGPGYAAQQDAARLAGLPNLAVISTDPPYYDNIGYADLSDFYYVWLRRCLRSVYPDLFSTVSVPKADELVATPARHGGRDNAEKFFLHGMKRAISRIRELSHPAYPISIYYAFKQSESDSQDGTVSTGWETFLDALIDAGCVISGTWPVRTERESRLRGQDSNALASSIVIVCRVRPSDAPSASRKEFVAKLKATLPAAVADMQRANIAPVDLAQAAIGPGMAVFTRYSQVLDAAGRPLTVREALALINQILDESLAEQESDFDADSRWALAWFEQFGFEDGEFGVAETLSKAKVTSVAGMVEAGILRSSKGKVRLLRPDQLPLNWDPTQDTRLTAWEMVHHLVRTLEEGGELAAAALVAKLGAEAEQARELAYRLYNICERKKRAAEALAYNGLVQAWPELTRLAEMSVPRQERLI